MMTKANAASPLTDQHRAWLRQPENATMLAWDMVRAFMKRFGLSPDEAGKLLAAWVREVY